MRITCPYCGERSLDEFSIQVTQPYAVPTARVQPPQPTSSATSMSARTHPESIASSGTTLPVATPGSW